MAQKTTHIAEPQRGEESTLAQFVRVHFKTLELPPVKDGVVIGRDSVVTPEVMLQTLRLSSGEHFRKLDVSDGVVNCVLVRESVLKKIKAEDIAAFILRRVKPFMSTGEILAIRLTIEIVLEDVI